MSSNTLDQFIEAMAEAPRIEPESFYLDKKPTGHRKVEVVTHCSEQYGTGFPPNRLNEFWFWLAERTAEVPAEHRPTAFIDFEAYDSYGEPEARVQVVYARPETDQEATNRAAREAEQSKHQTEKDRQTYERLKARFE